MPGVVKIGRSKHGGRIRAGHLYQRATGVPLPFKMEFEIWCNDCVVIELIVHEKQEKHRVSDSREFFSLSVRDAIIAVMNIAGLDYDCVTGGMDETIESDDLMINYFKSIKEIQKAYGNNNFPIKPLLTSIVRDCLSHEALISGAKEYKRMCNKRKHEMKENRRIRIVQ